MARSATLVAATYLVLLALPALAADPLESLALDAQTLQVKDPQPDGSLVIIGGSLRFGQVEVWSRIIDLAGGRGAQIAVFPTASDDPIAEGTRYVDQFNSLGAEAFLVPVAWSHVDVKCPQAVCDARLVEQVRRASGVFFVGGSQGMITRALYAEDGRNSPMLDAIWDLYRRGGVIAGTSAGAAVMSRVMYRDPPNVLRILQSGVTMGKEIDRGLGFLDPAWFVEQHTLARGRFARALVAMHSQGLKYGIGVDENTALIVRGDDVEVVGYQGAVVLDLSEASHDPEIKAFNLRNVKLSYLDRGDAINLKTLEIRPSQEKMGDTRLDPSSEDFHPYWDETLFSNDILGHTTVAVLLAKLIDNRSGEAIGLAFDGPLAQRQSAPGFEFRFYRDKDSVGWHTEAFGGDDYTVCNIHLDIRPVEVTGPLYR